MSDSHNDDDTANGTTTQTEEEMKETVEIHTSKEEDAEMGDIGNPPRGNLPQNSGEKETVPAPSTISPLSYSLPTISSPALVDSDMDVRRASSSTPPPPAEDGETGSESSSSIMDQSSPAPMKRSFVYNAREHEETDDFLLSTMLAIRTAVLAGTRDATKVEAAPEDFCASRKHKISMAGDRKVEIKDYAPIVFTLIRRHFGVSIPSYLLSWSDSRLAKSKSAGKSDSMFIHSPDHKFVLKTLVREEAKRLCKILRPYYDHLISNKDTFMSRIYGLHRMSRRRGQSDIYFAIFNNVFDTGHQLSEIYDLKGSTIGRRASGESPAQRRSSTSFEFRQVRKAITEEEAKPAKKPTVLKDLDFTRKLHVGPENRAKVLAQLSRDCKFLSQHQLMDYSLLIGVRRTDTPNGSSPNPNGESPQPSHATPISSPSPDQRERKIELETVVPVKYGVPIFVPSSPRARHSIVVPSSVPDSQRERVPGLLFFLESTKAATSKSLRETKRDRRKSVSEGAGSVLAAQQELNAIDEEDDEDEKPTTEPPKPTTDETKNPSDETNKPTDNSETLTATPDDTPKPPAQEPLPSTTPTVLPTEKQPNGVPESRAPMITVEPPDDDDDTPAEECKPLPPSPLVTRHGNSGDVGHAPVPSLKIATTLSPPTENGNGPKTADEDSDDSSIMDSPNASPRLSSLGMLTVSSVPNFNYFHTHPPPHGTIQKSGSSSLRVTSPNNNSPNLMKRNNRSASLTYVNLDPLCGSPHVPFYKSNEGGIQGATFVPLDTNKSNEVYYIGLIDFLQKYNKKKKLAGFAKSLKYEKEELSTVDPVFYMERFLKMTEKAIVE